jgi:calcineurin-like phosphoesterase family protein
MKKTYLISDLHLSHANIIKYCNRPFNDIIEMDNFLLEGIDDLPENSTLINLGDLCMSRYIDVDYMKSVVDYMKRDNKKLILILGNHDKQIRLKDKEQTLEQFYKELGFDKVYNNTLTLPEYNVILSHEPIKVENGFYNIHGHVHNNGFHEPWYNYKTHYNVSVENTEYKPILLKDILYNWDIKGD